ncbi:tripartite tricarboxylate transporter substrate binding protein [Halomonas lysinitropha]|uniref:tripartite tricarboxylate transporter substrate binding protein n=1 Tax=Halomonas lysinitropha TaxID=2607506 RepID=UPI001788C357|nr:tripartite tricarboxylate transporter substrate binding protein [Halomonas lysinitropha]
MLLPLLLALALSALTGHFAKAEATGHDIEIVVPTRAGGTLDLLARTIARHYEHSEFGNVRVNNIEGVAGERALAHFLASDEPDDIWLLGQESLITINPHVYGRDGTGIGTDLHPTASIAESYFYLLVRQDDEATDMASLIDSLSNADASVAYGSGGIGTLHHLSMEELGARLSLPLRHVPYRSNSAAVQGLMSGDVRMVMAGTSALGLVQSGDLRMLAVTAAERMSAFPDVPSLGEFVPGYKARNWFGIYTRMAMSEEVRDLAQRRLEHIVSQASFEETLRERGHISTLDLPTETFRDLIEEEAARFERLLQRLEE